MAKHRPAENRYCNGCKKTTKQVFQKLLPITYLCLRCGLLHFQHDPSRN